jgi:hypothetical protein
VPTTVDKPDTGRKPGESEGGGATGPRIRCPHCLWSPREFDLWSCSCGCSWNTFETGGVCPSCMKQWQDTQCLSCHRWAPHSAWYEY